MAHDNSIDGLLQRYFNLLYTCDVATFSDIFHPNAQLQTAGTTGYACLSAADYKEVLAKRSSPASLGAIRRDEVLAVDQSSDASAAAKVTAVINGVRYCDYLSLLKVDGAWLIVAKVYCVLPS